MGHGDLVGLGVDYRASQEVLAGHADGAEHALTAAMVGLLAIQGDQLLFGCWAAQPLLNFEQGLFELGPTDFLQQTPAGRLAGGRVAPLALADA